MGRLINTSELSKHIALQKKRFGNLFEVPICNVFADMIRDTPTAKAIPKDQYEARLRADMVAILEEIDLQFDEICFCRKGEWKTVPEIKSEYKAVVKQKINALKAESED